MINHDPHCASIQSSLVCDCAAMQKLFSGTPRELASSHGRVIHGKSWGWEEWLVNNDLYCGKRLHFEVIGGQTSLHLHAIKRETMYVESGRFVITKIRTTDASERKWEMDVGATLEISPLEPHRITCVEVGVLVEFSTHHYETDSYRVMK